MRYDSARSGARLPPAVSDRPEAPAEGRSGTAISTRARPSPRARGWLLAVAATYYLGARLGFVLRFPPADDLRDLAAQRAADGSAAADASHAAGGSSLAAALPAHLLAWRSRRDSAGASCRSSSTNCLEAVVAAGLVRAWSDGEARFDSLQRALAFVGGRGVPGAARLDASRRGRRAPTSRASPSASSASGAFFSNSLSQLTLVPSAVLLVRHGIALARASTRRQASRGDAPGAGARGRGLRPGLQRLPARRTRSCPEGPTRPCRS